MVESHAVVSTARTNRGSFNSRPPGPKGLPVLGSLLDFARDQLGFFTRCAREYGDLVEFNLAGWLSVLLSGSDDIEQVLVKNHKNFVKNRIIWRHVPAVFGQGILTSEGEFWQKQRRLAAPAFAGQQLLGYGSDMVNLTRGMLDGWKSDDVRDIHSEMMALTLRVAAKTLFDSEVEQDIVDMDHAVNDITAEMAARFKRPTVIPDWVPLPGHVRYRRGIRTVERVVKRIIAERRANGFTNGNDFLSRLMAARDENGQAMSDRQLRDEAVTLLLAGHETTALTLSWTWYLLGQHPEIDRRVAAELAETVGNRLVTVDDLPNLKFTESVILEAMRLYPPAWAIGRESLDEFQLAAYRFKPGTTVFMSPWVLHRDPRYFEDPETFVPDRWMSGLAHKLPRYAYMPFGGGPRICIGQRFAMIEATMILVTMAQQFSMELQRHREVTPFPSITLRPKGGVWARLQERAIVPSVDAQA